MSQTKHVVHRQFRKEKKSLEWIILAVMCSFLLHAIWISVYKATYYLLFLGRQYGDHEITKKQEEESHAKKEMTFR